ncbi:MAG: hypothetical protein JW737_01345 [Acidobacteria bacterium]|nr:hypothetical protein [Acidobacteriota bacterium]
MLKKGTLLFMGAVFILGIFSQSCNVLNLPNVAGTWDLTFYSEASNCPDVISPPMSQQVWVITQTDSQVSILIQTVDGNQVGYEFAVNVTLQADGNFSFNETFYLTYKTYYLRWNVICNATISGNTVSGDVQWGLQDMDTYESCVQYGSFTGTKRD